MVYFKDRSRIHGYRLPPGLDHRVQAYLGSGGYQSEDEVLRTALDALEEREQEKLHRWNEGNRTGATGLASVF
jgi:Arc/MetJ-type ribon-helix-helix transcriptional regulator